MAHSHDEEFRLNTPDAQPLNRRLDRRRFLLKTSLGLGALATGSLLGIRHCQAIKGQSFLQRCPQKRKCWRPFHISLPEPRRIVYLFMAGGPSQFETFDYKPALIKLVGQDLPESVRKGQRLTGMSAGQATAYCAFNF